jgi:hypothetical protein
MVLPISFVAVAAPSAPETPPPAPPAPATAPPTVTALMVVVEGADNSTLLVVVTLEPSIKARALS